MKEFGTNREFRRDDHTNYPFDIEVKDVQCWYHAPMMTISMDKSNIGEENHRTVWFLGKKSNCIAKRKTDRSISIGPYTSKSSKKCRFPTSTVTYNKESSLLA